MVSSAALAWTTIRATLICAIVKVKVLMKRNFLITFVTWELSSDDFHATSHHCGRLECFVIRERMWICLVWSAVWSGLGSNWRSSSMRPSSLRPRCSKNHSLDLFPILVLNLTCIFTLDRWGFFFFPDVCLTAMSQNLHEAEMPSSIPSLSFPTSRFWPHFVITNLRIHGLASQPLIWSQPTTARPANPNLMIITNPLHHFSATDIQLSFNVLVSLVSK